MSMQQLEVSVNIQIPSHLVLVEKVKLRELEEKSESVIGDMKWLLKETATKSPQTIKEKLLYPFRDELDLFVTYPDNGEHWKFNKFPMREWIQKNYKRVWK